MHIDSSGESMVDFTSENGWICVVLDFDSRNAIRVNVAFLEISHPISEIIHLSFARYSSQFVKIRKVVLSMERSLGIK